MVQFIGGPEITRSLILKTWGIFTPLLGILYFFRTIRMWNVWKNIGNKNKDISDKDWLDTGFLFYDENAELVRLR